METTLTGPVVRFERDDIEVLGVVPYKAHTTGGRNSSGGTFSNNFNFAWLHSRGFQSPSIIRVRGVFYLATETIDNIEGHTICGSKGNPGVIRYGPRARRHYAPITEEMLAGFRNIAKNTINKDWRKPTAVQVGRAQAILAFTDGIEELITGPESR